MTKKLKCTEKIKTVAIAIAKTAAKLLHYCIDKNYSKTSSRLGFENKFYFT